MTNRVKRAELLGTLLELVDRDFHASFIATKEKKVLCSMCNVEYNSIKSCHRCPFSHTKYSLATKLNPIIDRLKREDEKDDNSP